MTETRTTEKLNCQNIESIPSVEEIKRFPRTKRLQLIFGKNISGSRESIGNKLKNDLSGFQVGIHIQDPIITICKLITDAEIEANQNFFEQCAKDHCVLAKNLIFELAAHLGVEIDQQFPLQTFTPYLRSRRQDKGTVNGWSYALHGFHCNFTHRKTKQYIEVPLTFGHEFGVLDPYFFPQYIKSTKAYFPMPVEIYEDYADGSRILEKMVSLGKFEVINSNIQGQYGAVVCDRDDS